MIDLTNSKTKPKEVKMIEKETRETVLEKTMLISRIEYSDRHVKCERSYIAGVLDLAEELGYEVLSVIGKRIHGHCDSCYGMLIGDDAFRKSGNCIFCEACDKTIKENLEFINKHACHEYKAALKDFQEDQEEAEMPAYITFPMDGLNQRAVFPCGKEVEIDISSNSHYDQMIVFKEDLCRCELCKKISGFCEL